LGCCVCFSGSPVVWSRAESPGGPQGLTARLVRDHVKRILVLGDYFGLGVRSSPKADDHQAGYLTNFVGDLSRGYLGDKVVV